MDKPDWHTRITALCGGADLESMRVYAETQVKKAFDLFALWGWLEAQSDYILPDLPGSTKEERFARATLNVERHTRKERP